MLQLPALVLSLLLASAYAAIFYVMAGRKLRDLFLFWTASVLGFSLGQVAADMLDSLPWTIGEVHIVEATVGALLLLFVANWLKPEEQEK
jgi:hypothetical protein